MKLIFKKLYLFLLGITLVFSCNPDDNGGGNPPPIDVTPEFNFYPTSTTNVVVSHKYYKLSYVEKYEQAEWVSYELRKEHIKYITIERPFFEVDPKVPTGSADWVNYKDSGYTKGHLLPAADRKFSIEAYNETFYTSNISPQIYEFNAGIWLDLEEKERDWAIKYGRIYIATGGILHDGLPTIGYEEVAVPEYFYKVFVDWDEDPSKIKAIAFIMPHEERNQPITDFVTTIDNVENLTGIDFFPELPDNVENDIESRIDLEAWGLN